MAARIRPFEEADLAACVAVDNAADPTHPIGLSEARRDYDAWNVERYHRSGYVVEDEGGAILGWGQITHLPWQYHPDKYALRIEVEPRHRGRGVGGLLLERLLEELRGRKALLVRTALTEDNADGARFVTQRGFREVWRQLASRLDLASFDPSPFQNAAERVASQGITITTLAAEIERNPESLRGVYELHTLCNSGQTELDQLTPRPFKEWVAGEVEGPRSIPEAYFLALDAERYVGLSSLERLAGYDDTLEPGYTAVDPAYRERGIALALKLRTIAWAREHGYHYVKTDSNAINERMLSINRALGFESLPARITFELPLA